MAVRLLKLIGVLDATGLSKTGLYARIRAGEFPAPVTLSARSVAWRSDEVEHWVESRPKASADTAAARGKRPAKSEATAGV